MSSMDKSLDCCVGKEVELSLRVKYGENAAAGVLVSGRLRREMVLGFDMYVVDTPTALMTFTADIVRETQLVGRKYGKPRIFLK